MHHSSSFNQPPFQSYKISVQSNVTPIKAIPTTYTQARGYLEQPLMYQKNKLHQSQQSLLSINRTVSNLQTRAMRSHTNKQNDDNNNTNNNFSSGFYLNSYRHQIDVQQISLLLNMVQKYQQENPSAQDSAKQLYQEFFRNKLKLSQTIEQNVQSIQLRASQLCENKKSVSKKLKLQHKNLVKKLYSNLKEVVQHILNKEGETKFERLNQQLQDKEAASIVELRTKNLDSNDNILENIKLLRVLLSKKTDEYEILKEIESSLKLGNDNTQADLQEGTEYGFDTTTTTSILTASEKYSKVSRFSQELQKRKEKDDQKNIKKYFNIEKLKNQWHTLSEDQIKDTMHRTLVRDTLALQERQLIKRGGEKKITKEETLAKATSKQGISQLAITKDQLLYSQEQVRKNLISQAIPKIYTRQNNSSLSVSTLFTKLHSIEKIEPKQKGRKTNSMDVRKQQMQIEGGERAKKELLMHSQEQGSVQFMKKTLSYSSAFLEKAKSAMK